MDSNASNISATDGDESANGSSFAQDRTVGLIQVAILFLSLILAIAYMVLILAKPAFRHNKLNWFIINVCLTTAWFCVSMTLLNLQQLFNLNISLPCRVQGYLADMSACQLMYSLCVVAISRLFTIVYANKHIFRSNVYLWSCLAAGWLVAFLVPLPFFFEDGFTCSVANRGTFLSYYTLVTTVFLPVTIVAVCNARIFLFVHRSTRRVQAVTAGAQVSHARDVFLLKTMIATFSAFLIGWTPAFVTQMFNTTSSIPLFINICFQLLVVLTILHNVTLLIYTNQPVRAFLKQLFVRPPQDLPANAKRAEHQPPVVDH